LAERFLVSDQYVRQAAEEMKGQDLRYITSLEDRLQDIQKPGGRVLPVEAVAEQLAAPDVSARIAGFTEDELVRYIRRQFRGHRLTEADAREVLQRISLFQARRQIAFIAPDLRFPV
jgi:O-acetyl-ADP-ribose deacetylase (regulator of RNase III)